MRSCLLTSLCLFSVLTGAGPTALEAEEGSAGRRSSSDLLRALEGTSADRVSSIQRGNSLVLVFDDPEAEPVVQQAVALWQTCQESVSGMPSLVAFDARLQAEDGHDWSAYGDRRLEIEVAERSNDRRCGAFRGSTIRVFRRASKDAGGLRSCGSLSQNLAHEIGHALGLEDLPRQLRWQFAIMSRLHPGNLFSRRVQASECRSVDELWLTDAEAKTMGEATSRLRPFLSPEIR